MIFAQFRTSLNEIVTGEKLQAALDVVADDWESLAYRIRESDDYASHVTNEQKDANLTTRIAQAESIRRGQNLHQFWIWQRINAQLTGQCVSFLPKTGS